MKFSEITKLTRDGNYRINVDWQYLDEWIGRQTDPSLNLDPDFQRPHVWTREQQIAYVEYVLRGGIGSNELRFNCSGWQDHYTGPFEIVDGKQRITAALAFMHDELPVFDGHYLSDFEDHIRQIRPDFLVRINDLPDRASVLQWYLEINSGGTPHTDEEIARVQQLLEAENGS